MYKYLTIMAAAALLAISAACVKRELYFRYRYAIVQTTIDHQATDATELSRRGLGLRVWIVPERYYDRFAHLGITGAAYAQSSFAASEEFNDSIAGISVWILPASADSHTDSLNLFSDLSFRVEGESIWQNETQAVKSFNSKAASGSLPKYIDIRFDKFTFFTGYCYFSAKIYTRKSRPFLYSTSNKINVY
jgi:hypothetical protein